MKKLFFAILTIIIAASAFETQPIAVASYRMLEPSIGATHTAGLPVADNLRRGAITFTFPDSFFLPTTAILEALLTVKIVPDAALVESSAPLAVYCIPLTAPIGGPSAWTDISADLVNNYSEVAFYNPDSGTVFFEIAHILQSAAIGDIRLYGLILLPASESGAFRISTEPNAIKFDCAYGIGKRQVER
jgi:hypothetical protein